MNDKERLLQAAFDMALQTKVVKENQTDNADPDIKAAMIDYILTAAVGLNSDQISEFIADQTEMEDRYLKESFEEAAAEIKDIIHDLFDPVGCVFGIIYILAQVIRKIHSSQKLPSCLYDLVYWSSDLVAQSK